MNQLTECELGKKFSKFLFMCWLGSVCSCLHLPSETILMAQNGKLPDGLFALVDANDPLIPQLLLPTIHSKVVQQKLGLSTKQIDQLEEILRDIDRQWWPSRNLPIQQRREKIVELEELLWQKLSALFPVSLLKRLQQFELQAQGARLVLREDVADALQLTPVQRDEFRSSFKQFDKQRVELTKQNQPESDPNPDSNSDQQLAEIDRKEVESSYALLNSQQKERLASLLGEMIDFGVVQRTFPLAPELIDTGEWFGNSTTLGDAKGKVVILHFYAFQCSNCRRNFVHYNKWIEHFEDQPVMVIGIQTPETAAESDPGRVRDAATRDQFKFPVLIDVGKKNWEAWGNTMWPTIYIIDRNGYIRFWWQGELNWQGAEGDRVIKDLVNQLLIEE